MKQWWSHVGTVLYNPGASDSCHLHHTGVYLGIVQYSYWAYRMKLAQHWWYGGCSEVDCLQCFLRDLQDLGLAQLVLWEHLLVIYRSMISHWMQSVFLSPFIPLVDHHYHTHLVRWSWKICDHWCSRWTYHSWKEQIREYERRRPGVWW